MARTWIIEDHLCRDCGGRVLRCVSGNGMTPGGNPIYRCADCGKSVAAMGPQEICWCGFSHRMQHHMTAYCCIPFSILNFRPELLSAFRACGCDPERGEVGIMLVRDMLTEKK
jgi:hypothetical protein